MYPISAMVFCSPDGIVWTKVSKRGAMVSRSKGKERAAERYTFAGPLPVIEGEGEDITVHFSYAEEDHTAFDIVRDSYESEDKELWVQYCAAFWGKWYKTGGGSAVSLLYPRSGGVGQELHAGFTVRCIGVTVDDSPSGGLTQNDE